VVPASHGGPRRTDPERHAFGQRRRRTLVGFDAIVEHHDDKPRLCAQGHAVAFDHQFAGIHHRRDPPGGGIGQPLGHRHHDQPAVRLGQQTDPRHRFAACQRGGQVDPAKQAFVVDMRRDAAHRRALGQGLAQFVDHDLAMVLPAARDNAAKAGIDCAKPGCDQRIADGIGPDQATSSSSARSMRAVEPVSSSTLRRNRCRRAIGATTRM
jgi:hypothetical protein